MRLMDRYLLRELLIPLGYCLAGFLVFWVSWDLLTNLETFQRHHLSRLDIAQYYLISAPELVVTVLPLALLLALLYALSLHSRYNELTALRAAGVSLARLSLPYLAVGLGLAGTVFGLNEWWVPESTARAEALLQRHSDNPASDGQRWESKVGLANSRDNRKWLIARFNLDSYEMINPCVEWVRPDGSRQVTEAERGQWSGRGWVFWNVRQVVYPPERGAEPTEAWTTNCMRMTDFTETPDQIVSEIQVSRIRHFRQVRKVHLPVRVILNYRRLHLDRTEQTDLLDTLLHTRLAEPWTCLVVVLIALPFGTRLGQRNVLVGVAASLGICFSYFVLQQVALALGTRGVLNPWLGAWTPNLLFALAGLGLSWRVR